MFGHMSSIYGPTWKGFRDALMKTFEFWFDFGSPAAYLAFTQIARIETETGAHASYHPMLLGGVFHATGNQSPAAIPAKGSYIFHDFNRFAKRYGVPSSNNPHLPINTLLLMRGAIGIQQQEPSRFMAYYMAMFKAIWVDSLNMNDANVVGRV